MCGFIPAQPCSCEPDWLLVYETFAWVVERWCLDERQVAALLGRARREPLPRRPVRLPPRLLLRVLTLIQIDASLRQLIPDERIAEWLRRANPGLRWHTPLDLMLAVPRWITVIRNQLCWEVRG